MVATLREAEPVRVQARAADHLRHRVRRNLSAHGFLIGAVLCFCFFSWYPMCREIVMSFQKTQLGATSWAGWAGWAGGGRGGLGELRAHLPRPDLLGGLA